MHRGKKLSGYLALGVFAALGGMVAADSAFAKVDVDKLTLGGEARIRYEYRIGSTFGSAQPGGISQSNESAASSRVRVSVGYDLTPDVSFFAQLQDARIWGSECVTAAGCTTTSGIGGVSSQNQNGTGIDLHQGYILVKNILTPGLSAKIGRQEIIFGDHRLFGNFNWSQIGNSFDAVRLTHSMPIADIDLFWARIIDTEGAAGCAGTTTNCSGVIFNGANTKGTTDQDIYGAYVTFKPMPNWTIEPYYFLLKDSRPVVVVAAGVVPTFVNTPQAQDQARNIAGGRINGKAAGLDLTLEGVWEFGGIASGVTGTTGAVGYHDVHINAHAEAARIGYTFEPVPMKPRIGFEVDYGSGDNCVNQTTVHSSCAGKGHYNTFDNLFPTNHFHYGYMDLLAWKNMVAYSAMFDLKPDPVSKIQVNFWLMRLARTQDNWYRAGQVIYATSALNNQAASLGKELDIHYFRTFKEKFKFEVGYGHFFTGEYFEKNGGKNPSAANGPVSTTTFTSDSDQNWGYVMGSVLF